MKKFKRNDIILLKFWDHCLGDTPVIMSVVGFYINETDEYIRTSHWLMETYILTEQVANLEYSCVMKSCLIQKKLLSH